jgi:hypothetical protein
MARGSHITPKAEAMDGPRLPQLAAWSSSTILASGARGPGLHPRSSPITSPRGKRCSALRQAGRKLCRDPGSNRGPSDLQRDAVPTEPSRLLRRARQLDGPGPSQAPNALSLHPLRARKPLGSIPSVPVAKEPSRRWEREDDLDLVDRVALLGAMSHRLFLPVAERQSCKPKVLGSTPSGGLWDTIRHRFRDEGQARI